MAKEYIEREALFRFLSEQKDKETGAYSKGRNAGLDVARSALHNREITPAADVVEVVRCKDCKHYRYYGKTSLIVNGKNTNAGWCMRRTRASEEYRMLADDFCSYGERRTHQNILCDQNEG